jgi:hypothetical protein
MLTRPRPANFDAANSDEDPAKKLSDPVANVISVPFQNHVDFRGGAARDTLNVEPGIPFSLNNDWVLITRNIVPITGATSGLSRTGHDAFGMGDITSIFFLSPKQATSGGWIWGASPVALLPLATEKALGAGKFGLGPTAVLLRQDSGWTYGALANQIWSIAGPGGRAPISATFFQPFLAYTWKDGFTLNGNGESSFDWENGGRPTIPFNLVASQIVKIGNQPAPIGWRAGLIGACTSALPCCFRDRPAVQTSK